MIYDLVKKVSGIRYQVSDTGSDLELTDAPKPRQSVMALGHVVYNLQSAIKNPAWWPHAFVLVIYTGLALFYLAPLVAHFFENVPFGGDSWIFYWDLWWVKKAITELHTNPFYTTFVNFPQGASLNFHTLAFLDGVMAIPLQWLGMSLAGAYNSLVFFGYIFSAYGMFLLADYVVGYKPGAFVAGLVFGFSPFHFAHLIGQLNFVSIQWMPFYVLFLLKALDAPRLDKSGWLKIGLTSLFLALNALTEWTLAAFLVLFTAIYILYRLWQGRREWRTTWVGPIVRIAMIMVFFGIITSPILIPMVNEARSNQNIKYDPEESVTYSVDLLSFVVPYEMHPILGEASLPHAQKYRPLSNPAERTAYLGFSVLLLAALGSWFYRKKRAGVWLLSGIFFALLALGPQLSIGGRSIFTVFKLTVPMPYAALYYLPFFSIMRTPGRFVVMTMLALAILAAFGIKALSERITPRLKNPNWQKAAVAGLVTIFGLLIAFEFAPAVGSAYPNVPPIYDPIRQDTDASQAVLELPYRPTSHFYIAQVAYQKPLIDGYLARQIDNPLVDQVPALKTLALRSDIPTGTADQLRAAHVGYVVVNWWMLDNDQKTKMQAALQQVFARPPDDLQMEPDGSKIRITRYDLTGN